MIGIDERPLTDLRQLQETSRRGITRLLLYTACVVAVLSLASTLQASSEPCPLDCVIARVNEARESLRSLDMNFTHYRIYHQLGIEDPPQSGRLWIRKDSDDLDARLESDPPDERVIVVHDGTFIFYQPRLQQALVGRLSERRQDNDAVGFLRFLLSDIPTLQRHYRVELSAQSPDNTASAVTLILTPRPDSVGPYRRVELEIDPVSWLPVRQRLEEVGGSEQHIELEILSTNRKLDDALFQLKLPKHVKRITS